LAAKINGLINNGRLDNYLDAVTDAIIRRRKYLRDKKALTLIAEARPGDRVEVVGTIKPRYMLGERGVIVEAPPGRMPKRFFQWVELDRVPNSNRQGGRRWSRTVLMPASCLRIILKASDFTAHPDGMVTSS
jgi:hypothetical protein